MNESVSVIMPVYNAEKYVLKSVNSVLNQTYKNLELLVVNDGSTDSTESLLNQVQDERLKILTVKNGGPARARNRGISEAKGEIIQFVDADDYLDVDALEKLLPHFNEQDYLVTGYKTFEDGREVVTSVDRTGSFSGEDIAEQYLDLFDKQYIKHLWNKLYRKSLLDKYNIQFHEQLKRGEGIVFNLDYLKRTRQAVFVDCPVYNHNDDNKESITSRYLPEFVENTNKVFQTISEYLSVYLKEETYTDRLSQFYTERMIHYIQVLATSDEPDEETRKAEINKVVSHPYFQEALSSYRPATLKTRVLKVLLRMQASGLLYTYYSKAGQ